MICRGSTAPRVAWWSTTTWSERGRPRTRTRPRPPRGGEKMHSTWPFGRTPNKVRSAPSCPGIGLMEPCDQTQIRADAVSQHGPEQDGRADAAIEQPFVHAIGNDRQPPARAQFGEGTQRFQGVETPPHGASCTVGAAATGVGAAMVDAWTGVRRLVCGCSLPPRRFNARLGRASRAFASSARHGGSQGPFLA